MPCSLFLDVLVPLSLACYVLPDYETERRGLYRELRSYLSSRDCHTVEQLIDSSQYILRDDGTNSVHYFTMDEIWCGKVRPMAAAVIDPQGPDSKAW